MSKIVILTGAGISAESGIRTFRDAGGLWEGYKIEDVATPEAWRRNPEMVLRFYNERRKQLLEVSPNDGHNSLTLLEQYHDTIVITQNVDDLHERAGSKKVIHLHGELLKKRSSKYDDLIYPCMEDIQIGDLCERGFQLRPHIVWFGEMVPMLETAIDAITDASIVLVIGSSMQVYPAASLVAYAPPQAEIYYIDPNPKLNYELSRRPGLQIIPKVASVGVKEIVEKIISSA
ncbi:MAG: NAD-dependent deacylase [Saprospiraceae bacterium]|nr:NAD-dependent deacylase [Candidatus Opimibacter iunctus]